MSSAVTSFFRKVIATGAWLVMKRWWLTGVPRRLRLAVPSVFLAANCFYVHGSHGLLLGSAEKRQLTFGGERPDRVQVPPGSVVGLVVPRELLDGGVEIQEPQELGDFTL